MEVDLVSAITQNGLGEVSLVACIAYLYRENRQLQKDRLEQLQKDLALFQKVALQASGGGDATGD